MPDVTPPRVAEQRAAFQAAMPGPMPPPEFCQPGVCEWCGAVIDTGAEDYRVGLDGCWIHEWCL